MGGVDDSNQELFELFRRLLVENYMIFATSILLFYDHAITFPREIKCVWRRKFSGATILFLVTRYSATLERIVLLVTLFLNTESDESCVKVLRLDDALIDLNTLAIGVFMAVRIYAIWGQDVRLFVLMMVFVLARVAISIWFQAHYSPIAFGAPLYGCGAEFHVPAGLYNHLHVASDSAGLASDILLLVLTWIKTLEISRTSTRMNVRTPIATLLLRDGTMYFTIVFFLQVMSIVSQQVGVNFELFQVWTYWNQSITVIFLCRFMLNLRNVHIGGASPSSSSDTSDASTIRFRLHSEPHFSPSINVPRTDYGLDSNDYGGERHRGKEKGKSSRLVGNLGAPLLFGSSEDPDVDSSPLSSPVVHGHDPERRDGGVDDTVPSTGGDNIERIDDEDADVTEEMIVVTDANPLGAGLLEQPVEMVEMRTSV